MIVRPVSGLNTFGCSSWSRFLVMFSSRKVDKPAKALTWIVSIRLLSKSSQVSLVPKKDIGPNDVKWFPVISSVSRLAALPKAFSWIRLSSDEKICIPAMLSKLVISWVMTNVVLESWISTLTTSSLLRPGIWMPVITMFWFSLSLSMWKFGIRQV